VRASKRVGATGVVLAEDINPLAIEYIGKRILAENLTNIKTVLGQPDDPMLPGGSVDAVLLLKVYHEIAHPVDFMKKLRPAMRAGGKIGIIDKNGNGADHGVAHEVVEREMGEAGFRLASTYDFTKADGQDYFMIFVAK
jgi:ubiquinone/menaquinone biosynthesis C-methylase UbiE